jgi:hypothetical protein
VWTILNANFLSLSLFTRYRNDSVPLFVDITNLSLTISSPIPANPNFLPFFLARLPDMQEIRLCQFCLRYWGRGDEGRHEIYKDQDISVPYLNDGRDIDEPEGESQDDADEESDASAATTSTISYTVLSLGPDFEDFFGPSRDKILVRDEYRAMLNHIKTIQKKYFYGGAVLIGQPGIGKRLSQFTERS